MNDGDLPVIVQSFADLVANHPTHRRTTDRAERTAAGQDSATNGTDTRPDSRTLVLC
jgi:hypothetical protein